MNSTVGSAFRSFALALTVASTAWLLVADSAEECTVPAEDVRIRMLAPCAAELRVLRTEDECYGSLTSSSAAILISTSNVDLHEEPAASAVIQFSFDRLDRTEGVALFGGSCTLRGNNLTYDCSGTSSTSAMIERVEGSYEVNP